MKKRIPLLKKKKHNKIVNDYDRTKSKHLERLADKMLEDQDRLDKLREKNSDVKFLDLF